MKRKIFSVGTIIICLMSITISFGAHSAQKQAEEQEYNKAMAHIKAMRDSIDSGQIVKLEDYEKFTDEILKKWSQRNKEKYSRLILQICGPLRSGQFSDDRQYDVARKYALSILGEPNEIPVIMELELTGYVVTLTHLPNPPKGEDFAQRRKKEVDIHLHAWKRLIDSIDPKWDPCDLPLLNVSPPPSSGLPSGVSPEAIKDPKIRAEYENAIEKNRQKAERHLEQYTLRKWLNRFPKRAEIYIVDAHSKPPFNLEELKQYLDKYKINEKTKTRIIETVTKNIEKQTKRNKE